MCLIGRKKEGKIDRVHIYSTIIITNLYMIISASLMPQQMLPCNIPIGLQTVLLMLPIILTTLKIVQSLRLVQIIFDYNHFTYIMYGILKIIYY